MCGACRPWDLRDFFTISCAIHAIQRPKFAYVMLWQHMRHAMTVTAHRMEWVDLRKAFATHYGKRENVAGMLRLIGRKFEV